MTGNQIKGKGFRGALRYNLDKVERGVAEVLDHSFTRTSESSIMKEIQLVRVLRPNLQKYFYHTSINFPPNEDLSNHMMKQIGHDYLKANGFIQNHFIMFRHRDANHPHLHILVNRIGYDGKVVSDSNDYKRSETVLRDLEAKYNLTRVEPSKEVKERAMTKDELEMMKRTKKPSQKMLLQAIVKDVLKQKSMTTQVFIQVLQDKGVNVLFNQATTGFVSGISYGYQGFMIKGAKLGRDFKWSSIKNVINFDQELNREIVQQANIRARIANTQLEGTNTNKTWSKATIFEGKGLSNSENVNRDNGQSETLKNLLNDNNDLINNDTQLHADSGNLFSRKKKKKRRKGRGL